MNIFVLDSRPMVAAQFQCDKHVPKMIVENMQMLTTALVKSGSLSQSELPFRVDGETRYSGNAYPHHPCTKWVGKDLTRNRENVSEVYGINYAWLWLNTEQLFVEYNRRISKVHGCLKAYNQLPIPNTNSIQCAKYKMAHNTDFVLAMPDEYKDPDAVVAYRNYYHSKTFAKWEKDPRPNGNTPLWWKGHKGGI